MMETVRMQSTMPHQQQHQRLHQMIYKAPDPDLDGLLAMKMTGHNGETNVPSANAMDERHFHQQNPRPGFGNAPQQINSTGMHLDHRYNTSYQAPPPLTQHPLAFPNGNNMYQSSNKRLSVDFTSNLSDYSVDSSWTGSPRSTTSSDESLENNPLQVTRPVSKGSTNTAIYPGNNVKRQNVGRLFPLASHQLANSSNVQSMPNLSQKVPPQPYCQYPLPPPPNLAHSMQANNGFYGHSRPEPLQNVGQRPEMHFAPGPQQQQQRHPAPMLLGHPMPHPPPNSHHNQHQLQLQNFYFTGPMGPPPVTEPEDPSNQAAEKRSRFMRTAQLLEQSGLMDVTLKTAALMRENSKVQREIDALTAETNHLMEHFLATRCSNPASAPQQQQQPHLQLQQQFPSPMQMQQQQQQMFQRQSNYQLPPQVQIQQQQQSQQQQQQMQRYPQLQPPGSQLMLDY